MQLPKDMQEDISPKNLLMIGPTGVGKTEIAHRLAKIVNAPFVKVEATKFTEVGYVGRDVESMARDLVEVAYRMEQNDAFKQVRAQAAQQANKRLVKLIVPAKKKQENPNQYLFNALRDLQSGSFPNMNGNDMEEVTEDVRNERLSVAEQLKRGLLENNEVTIQVDDPSTQFNNQSGMLGQMGIDLSSLSSMMPTKKVERTMTVAEAREILIKEESEKLVNSADLADAAIKRASLLMKLIKLLLNLNKMQVKFHVKVCNVISYQLLKVLKFQLSMAWLRLTTFYSLVLVLSMKVNQVI